MAYTNPWSPTIPPGTIQAKLLDDHIRQARLDLGERLATFFTDLDADPLVPIDQWAGKVTSKKLLVHFSKFITSGAHQFQLDNFFVDAAGITVFLPIELPPGVKLTRVELLVDKLISGSLTWEVVQQLFGNPSTRSVQVQVVDSTAGLHISTHVGDLNVTIADNATYCLKYTSTATSRIYGARLTYDTPDMRFTL